jgi:hypothetical protein
LYKIIFKSGKEIEIPLDDGHYQKFDEYLNTIIPDILDDSVRKIMIASIHKAKENILKEQGIIKKSTDIPESAIKTDISD